MVNKSLYTLLARLLLAGCDLIGYHPYDVRISGETDVNTHNIEQIKAKYKEETTTRFVTMGDSQRRYNETEDSVKEVNKKDDIDFVTHGRDMSDFGLTKEFFWQRDTMNGLKVPYVVLIGNHDCLGTGAETYQAVSEPTNFSFIAGDMKFVYLNTNALKYNYSEPIPNSDFMEQELTDRVDKFEKTVVSMHAHPLTDMFDGNVTRPLQYYIAQYPELQSCTAARNHGFDDRILSDGNVHYIVNDYMKSHSYLVFAMTSEEYEYELVEY